MDLNIVWFGILGVLLTGYAMLDGFDLGVGILHLAVKTDDEHRILMNSIAPIWDGNEVWLVTFGGALFAAFPNAYATAFSAFYLPFMLLLFALIFRGVSMEFRGKRESRLWRAFWDVSFCLGSVVATFLFGVAVGNSMLGMPIGQGMEFEGSLRDMLRPYPILIGFLAVSLFAMHGSIYLHLKTEGRLQKRVQRWMWRSFGIFMVLYMLTTIFTLVKVPTAIWNFQKYPAAWAIVVLNVLALANIPRAIYLKRPLYAFLSSCATIAALNFLFGAAMYPNLIVSSLNPAWNLNIYNAASSNKTLGIMLIVAVLGMPFVLGYTAAIYWVFRGKVKLDKLSY